MSLQPASRLSRRLGVLDAVTVGLGSMLGTGVFVVFAPAAARAGGLLLVALLLAAAVAYCNATSSAQLAAVHPRSGGAYVYGRERLGPAWGALAGYAFLAGKVSSCAAAALAVGAYAWPVHSRTVACLAVLAATTINYLGVTRSVRVTRVLVVLLLGALALVVVAGLSASGTRTGILSAGRWGGVLPAAALLFFAFAGYARIATLGEEVRDPARTIPRAIPLALALALVAYLAVAVATLHALGPDLLARTSAPLAATARAAGASALEPLVRVAGAVAAGAALLNLVAGVSRTAFAMGAERDLPGVLAAVHPRYAVPHRAEVAVGVIALIAVLVGGLVGAVAFSACTVLVYYAVANLSALRLAPHERRWPRPLAAAGLVGCLALAASLSPVTVGATVAALGGALAVRAGVRQVRPLRPG